MFEAEYTHEGDRCTFETLIARFGLDDRAFDAVAEMVHDIDLRDEQFGRPETPGFERLLSGLVASTRRRGPAHRGVDHRGGLLSGVPVTQPISLGGLTGYFLRLGTFGFGGPIALVGYMQRDLVDGGDGSRPRSTRKGWRSRSSRPGPLAAQLAIYLGWARLRDARGDARRPRLRGAVVRHGARARRRSYLRVRRHAVDPGRVLRDRRGGHRDHRAQRVEAAPGQTLGKRPPALGRLGA